MKQFHGKHKKHSFFEGWYLKHQIKDFTISFIPAFHIDSCGNSSVSIQVITSEYSQQITFPTEHLLNNKDRFSIQIAKNHFSDTGIAVNLQQDGFYVLGELTYDNLIRPARDIMGPARFVPWLQCNHGLISLSHSLHGTLEVNGSLIDFSGGVGYIEKDWGCSFPQSYLWTQGNWISSTKAPCSLMLSLAHIPVLSTGFTGCIGSIYYEGVEYRLATYHHLKILHYSPEKVIVKQGTYSLTVELIASSPLPLYAPMEGCMNRTIYESVSCRVRYHFSISGNTLFDITLANASYEAC